MKKFLYSIIIIYSLNINVYADVSDKISAKVNDYFSNLIPGNGITEVSIDLRENNSPDFSILAVRELEKSFILQQIDYSWQEHLQKIAFLIIQSQKNMV